MQLRKAHWRSINIDVFNQFRAHDLARSKIVRWIKNIIEKYFEGNMESRKIYSQCYRNFSYRYILFQENRSIILIRSR